MVFPLYAAFPDDQDLADTLRVVAGEQRAECLTVQLPGIPGAEFLATAAEWWAGKAAAWFGPVVQPVGAVNEYVTGEIQQLVGVKPQWKGEGSVARRLTGSELAAAGGYLVQVPNWQDLFIFDNKAVLDERSRAAKQKDHLEQLLRSPTPPSLSEIGELLTILDDVQDEAATLALVLMLVEKLAGRVIPGVGWVATAADALNLIQAIARPATGSGLPGRAGKRRVTEKGRATRNGYGGRVEDLRRTGSLRIGVGDLLQGLQASESAFGVGVQLGGIFGFLQDAFWGLVRGAEFRAAGPAWDPLGFTEAGRAACFRSPTLDQVHPRAYYALANTALRLWSRAARLMPYVDIFGEPALASALVGLRLSEQVLNPWLVSGVWVDLLERSLEIQERVAGGVDAFELRRLPADTWLKRTVPAAVVATTRAIGDVADRGRQAFYESLVSSIGWGFLGAIEPDGVLRERQVMGPIRDAWALAEFGRVPLLDLGE